MDIPPPPGQTPETPSGGHESYFGYEAELNPLAAAAAAEDRVTLENAEREEIGAKEEPKRFFAPSRLDGKWVSSLPVEELQVEWRQTLLDMLPSTDLGLDRERMATFLGSIGLQEVPFQVVEDFDDPSVKRAFAEIHHARVALSAEPGHHLMGKYLYLPHVSLLNAASIGEDALHAEYTHIHEAVHGNEVRDYRLVEDKDGNTVIGWPQGGPFRREINPENKSGKREYTGNWPNEGIAELVAAHFSLFNGAASDEIAYVGSQPRVGRYWIPDDRPIVTAMRPALALEAMIDRRPDILPLALGVLVGQESYDRLKAEIDMIAPGKGLSEYFDSARLGNTAEDRDTMCTIFALTHPDFDTRLLAKIGSVSRDYFRDMLRDNPGHYPMHDLI